jgi:hypothetical protein
VQGVEFKRVQLTIVLILSTFFWTWSDFLQGGSRTPKMGVLDVLEGVWWTSPDQDPTDPRRGRACRARSKGHLWTSHDQVDHPPHAERPYASWELTTSSGYSRDARERRADTTDHRSDGSESASLFGAVERRYIVLLTSTAVSLWGTRLTCAVTAAA